jgi:hypothetical protein
MPLPKGPIREPASKTAMLKAQRDGLRAAITLANGDVYTGEWRGDLRHGSWWGGWGGPRLRVVVGLLLWWLMGNGLGVWRWAGKGSHVYTAARKVYDGDWRDGERDGYGVLSRLPAAGAAAGKGAAVKEYAGNWRAGVRHGQGTNFYANGEQYDGEWAGGRRHGWGHMRYADGSVYEGEWEDDVRCGRGLLVLAGGDRYEGAWAADAKDGPGIYYYLAKGRRFEGVWAAGTPKGGEMFDLDPHRAFPLPEVRVREWGRGRAGAHSPPPHPRVCVCARLPADQAGRPDAGHRPPLCARVDTTPSSGCPCK